MTEVRIPAKAILFGEHTVLRGSRALAMPLWKHSCSWQNGGAAQQQDTLRQFANYLEEHLPSDFDLVRFRQELDEGLFLDSTIPIGYGLGSSGAVCVAVYRRYGTARSQAQLEEAGAKAFYARMEAFFHGTSSGTDPLIIDLQKSVQLFPDGRYQLAPLVPLSPPFQFFLLDTRHPRSTGPIVQYFTDRFDKDDSFRKITQEQWIRATDNAIDALLEGQEDRLWDAFQQISGFQLANLPPMILPEIIPAWENGLQKKCYFLKICGAGGGGYCLGMTKNWEETARELKEWSPFLLGLG